MSSARKRSRISRLKAELDRAQQLSMIAGHSADVQRGVSNVAIHMAERMRTALLEARAFIAAERQSFVECSTDPTTHQLDPDDYHYADQMTALLARIDAALGEGGKT